jgi:hypothetical protein
MHFYLPTAERNTIMGKMEQQELDAHRDAIVADMRGLFEKYRAIFGWDIPEVDQKNADKLILAAMHSALDHIAIP